jgi:hypothetical protein
MTNCIECGTATPPRNKYCDDCRDTAAPWRVDPAAVSRALADLGVVAPVDIRRSSGRNTKGRYHGMSLLADDNNDLVLCHRITVAARLHPADASRTIWHELTHASQFECDVAGYNAKYKQYAYTSNPYELEAKANERYHDTKFSLTLVNKRANMRPTNHPRVAAVVDGNIVDGVYADRYRQYNLNRIRDAEAALGR